jgi:tetratricopeptide (TPR) repeat protein
VNFAAEDMMILGGRVAVLALLGLLISPERVHAAGADDANRAVVAARNGQYEEAIDLFTRAINSDELGTANRARAFAYRGIAKATTGDYEAAQLDLNSAIALDTDFNGDAYGYRGYLRLVLGENKDAVADLEKSAELMLWPYNVLWLHLARLKAGLPDSGPRSLANNAITLDINRNQDGTPGLSRWPGALVKFMQGTVTREAVDAAAQEGDPKRLAERVCDVDFYVAELDLARNDAAAAKPKLERAAEMCPFASFERMGATAELTRLK